MRLKAKLLEPWIFCAALCACLAIPSARSGDQPQWGERYSRNLISSETGLPETFDPEKGTGIKWSVKLGTQTYSTATVAGGRVFIGTNNDAPRDPRHKGDRGVLLCLDEKDGGLLWQLVVPKRTEDPYLDWPRTGIVSPATVEGDRAYVMSNRGEVVCLDVRGLSNGNDGPFVEEGRHMVPAGEEPMTPGPTDADILWIFDVASGAGVHHHDAAHGSILIDGEFLYVCTSNGVDNTHLVIRAPEAPGLIVLEKATGRLVARDMERMAPRTIHSTWSSPSLGEVNGRRLIFFGGGDGVCYAFDALRSPPEKGAVARLQRVWRFDCDPGAPKENIFEFQDDRRQGPSNITGMPVFHAGRVYVEAGGDVWHGKRQVWLKCIDATRTGDVTGTGQVWSQPLEKHSMSTPSIHEGLAYMTDCGGNVRCFDADTGEPVWTHDAKAEIWASTLVADGKVYVGTHRGELLVLAAGREKKLLFSADLGSPIHGTACAANGVLYVATMTRLYALARTQAGTQAPAHD